MALGRLGRTVLSITSMRKEVERHRQQLREKNSIIVNQNARISQLADELSRTKIQLDRLRNHHQRIHGHE